MKLTELTHLDQLQLELVRHGWAKCVDHPPKIASPVFSYSEERCPRCEAIHRTLVLYPQHDDFDADVWVQCNVNAHGQIVSWSYGECYGPNFEEFEPGELELEPISIASAINSWLARLIA